MMNILSYIIYIVLSSYITVIVGYYFYSFGRIYILALFHQDTQRADSINQLLLMGYYLVNIGYIALTINDWIVVKHAFELFTIVGIRLGKIILLLAILHYINMFTLYFLSQNNPFHKPF